eukprot:2964921-Rhodomonas_salina.5
MQQSFVRRAKQGACRHDGREGWSVGMSSRRKVMLVLECWVRQTHQNQHRCDWANSYSNIAATDPTPT